MRKIRNRMIDFVAASLYKIFKLFFISNKFKSLLIGDYDKDMPIVTIEANDVLYKFYSPNKITQWRADSLFEKEPETIEWINSFESGAVLYDIGANVGTYTIYASVSDKVSKVISFEPEAANYAILNRNICLNGMSEKVTALNVAISNVSKLDYLYLSSLGTGNALHNFGKNVGYDKKNFSSVFIQGSISITLDEFIQKYNPEFPTHIKIDVDGLEKEIVEGATNTLHDSRLKELLIEINEELAEDLLIVEEIKKCGFQLKHKKHSDMFKTGQYSKSYNYIFKRGKA